MPLFAADVVAEPLLSRLRPASHTSLLPLTPFPAVPRQTAVFLRPSLAARPASRRKAKEDTVGRNRPAVRLLDGVLGLRVVRRRPLTSLPSKAELVTNRLLPSTSLGVPSPSRPFEESAVVSLLLRRPTLEATTGLPSCVAPTPSLLRLVRPETLPTVVDVRPSSAKGLRKVATALSKSLRLVAA